MRADSGTIRQAAMDESIREVAGTVIEPILRLTVRATQLSRGLINQLDINHGDGELFLGRPVG